MATPSIHAKLKWLPIKVLDLDNLTEKWVGCTGVGPTHLVLSAAHPVPKNRGGSSLQKYLTLQCIGESGFLGPCLDLPLQFRVIACPSQFVPKSFCSCFSRFILRFFLITCKHLFKSTRHTKFPKSSAKFLYSLCCTCFVAYSQNRSSVRRKILLMN